MSVSTGTVMVVMGRTFLPADIGGPGRHCELLAVGLHIRVQSENDIRPRDRNIAAGGGDNDGLTRAREIAPVGQVNGDNGLIAFDFNADVGSDFCHDEMGLSAGLWAGQRATRELLTDSLDAREWHPAASNHHIFLE